MVSRAKLDGHGILVVAYQRSDCKREARRIKTMRRSAAMASNILRCISFWSVPDAVLSAACPVRYPRRSKARRSEEHTSELQSLMRLSYAVFCLKKKKQ